MKLPVRNIVLLVLMLATAVLSILLTPRTFLADASPKIDMEAAIPQVFGDWVVDPAVNPVNPSPEQKETLEQIYDQTVNRTYINSHGQRIMLSIAHGAVQTPKLRSHRQEVCYAAQGFQITELRHDLISVAGVDIPATRMVALLGGRVEPVTYWFTMGDYVVRSYLDRQMAQLRYAFSGLIPDGYLFRVSSIGSDKDAAFSMQLDFSKQLIDSISPELRNKLLGGI